MLELRNASYAKAGRRIVADVDIRICEQEFTLIVGGNGSGKTSLLNLLSGHSRLNAGGRYLQGADVTTWDTARLSRRGVARLMQRSAILPSRSALENAVILNTEEWRRGWPSMTAMPNARRALAKSLLNELDYPFDVDHTVPGTPFAVRIVEFARALTLSPKVLILDEPMAGMEAESRKHILRIMSLVRARGTAIVLVEHRVDEALALADTVLTMDDGRLI